MEKSTEAIQFATSPMHVFIEDTDAYGIMYNGNYLRAYDRALHMTVTQSTTTAKATSTNNQEISSQGSFKNLISSDHEGWSIVSLGTQKFMAPIALGNEFVIEGILQKESSNQLCETWAMHMTSVDGSQVYNSIQDLKIARPDSSRGGSLFAVPNPEPFAVDEDGGATSSHSFPIYRDEIDAHWPGHLPLRNVLKLFEQGRSVDLGGPSALKKLKEDDGILSVVASISDFCLIDEGAICHAGDEVAVEAIYVMKRKGMIFECFQTLTKDGRRLAQGMTTIMMISDRTGRPTANVPQYLLDRFSAKSEKSNEIL